MLKVIQVAIDELGYLEKKSNSQLDSDTANAGYNNYTKYARDLAKVPGWYGGNKNGYAWCDVFVDWCFVQAYGVDLAKKLLNNGIYGAGCHWSARYFRNIGRFHKKNPLPGDQIFFGTEGSESHTGIVEKVDSTRVYTIEGNTSAGSAVVANGGGVYRKSYLLSNSKICGYGRPDYSLVNESSGSASQTAVSTQTNNSSVGRTCEVTLNQVKKGDKGHEVKAMQMLLIGSGYSCGSTGADGDFGKNTDSAIRAFQIDKKLVVDGICGVKTWTKLLKG